MQATYKVDKANVLTISNLGIVNERVYVRDIGRVWVSPMYSNGTYDIYFRITEGGEQEDGARTIIQKYDGESFVVRIGGIRECLDSFNEIKQMMKDESRQIIPRLTYSRTSI